MSQSVQISRIEERRNGLSVVSIFGMPIRLSKFTALSKAFVANTLGRLDIVPLISMFPYLVLWCNSRSCAGFKDL